MKKQTIVALLLVLACSVVLVGYLFGCGQTGGGGTTASGTVTIKGLASSSGLSSIQGIKASSALSGATVTIGKPAKNSEDMTAIATGITGSDGTYSIDVDFSQVSSLTDSNNKVNNLMVIITQNGTTLGATIPAIDTATKSAFAPSADETGYMKQKIALKTIKKGMDPKDLDFSGDIDQKFTNFEGYKSTDDSKFDKMADAVKNSNEVGDDIAAGLGISTTILAQLEAKAKEYHDTYIQPIFKAAFDNKTPPDKTTLDTAFANMEKALKDYALTLGITEQQFLDLKNMKGQQMQSDIEQDLGAQDNAVKGFKQQENGNKMIDLFNAQYDAANTLAQASIGSKQSFANASPTQYAAFVASKEAIATVLKAKLNDATIINPMEIGNYLRLAFFDRWLFPPMAEMPSKEGEKNSGEMETIMSGYKSSRIMMYFMDFFSESQRQSIFQSMGSTLQPIFQNRFQNTGSPYYMGEQFWASNPTPTEIQTRLGLFKTALDNAINSIVKTPFESVFGASTTTNTYINSFKILNAPPDAF